jgi:hypothetical protein
MRSLLTSSGVIANGQAVAERLPLGMIKTNIEALLIGKPVSFRGEGEDSSIGSRMPADGAVHLTVTGFEGDRVGDPSVHGGANKAVHFYPGEHYPLWEADFAKAGREPHPHLGRLGGFGENISALEMTEDRVQIGDRFRIGGALVEISQGAATLLEDRSSFRSEGDAGCGDPDGAERLLFSRYRGGAGPSG